MTERARSVLLTLLLVVSSVSAGVGSVAATPTGDATTFHVTQGQNCYEISPITTSDDTVEEFYDYRSGSETKYASYGENSKAIQDNQVSHLFVYKGSKGLSLVMLHDELNSSKAGAISFDISGLPADRTWAVEDDDYPNQDDNFDHSGTSSSIDWMWDDGRTDGAAVRGLGGSFDAITIESAFGENSWAYQKRDPKWEQATDNVDWKLRSGDGTEYDLTKGQSLTIEKGGCPDETAPNAALSATPQTAQTGESVSFDAGESSDGQTSIAEYRWDFDGDGQIDRNTTSATTSYAYDAADTYDASVTVVDEGGNTASANETVTVESGNSSGPTVTLDAPGTVNVSEQFTVSADAPNASNVSSYEWTFDSTTKNGTEVSHSYDKAGTYDVTVNVTYDNGTSVEESATVEVVAQSDGSPTAAFSFSSQTVANNEAVELDASNSSDDEGIVSFDWQFGDGESASGETVNHTYDSTGEYNVTLTVTDTDGNTDTANGTVTVTEPKTIEYVNATAVRIHGDYETVFVDATFFGTSGVGTSNYDLGPVNGTTVVHAQDEGKWGPVISSVSVHEEGIDTPANASKKNPDFEAQLDAVRPERPSTFVQNATKVDNGTYNITFGYVNPNDHAMLGGSKLVSANGSEESTKTFEPGRHTFTVEWTPENNDSNLVWETDFSTFGLGASTTTSPTPEQIESGDMPPVASLAAAPTTVEVDETVAFTAGQSRDDENVTAYKWDFDGDGTVDRTTEKSNVTHQYSAAGSYHATVTVVDTSGQTDSTQSTVTVEKASTEPPKDTGPNAALAVDDTFAFGSIGKLVASGSTGDGDLTYQWDIVGDDGYEHDTGKQSYVGIETWNVYDEEGTYEVSVTVTEADGDTDTATKTVEVVDLQGPTAKLVAPDNVTVGEQFNVTAKGAGDPSGLDYINWKFDGENRTKGKVATHTFHETGNKTVTLLMRDLEGHNTRMQTTVNVLPADDDSKNGDDGDSKKGVKDGNNGGSNGGYVPPANPGGNGGNSNDDSDAKNTDDSKVTAPLTDADGNVGSVTVHASSSDADPTVKVSDTVPANVTAPTVQKDGFAALSYLNVSGADRTTFTVSKDRLNESGAAPGAVELFRYENGSWSAVETSRLNETDDAYRFGANVSNGTFAVGIGKAVTSVTDLSVGSASVKPGTSVTVTATVRNTGHAAGEQKVELTVGGEVVATKTVSVAAGDATDVTFTHTLGESGVYEVAVGSQNAEIVVEGVDTTTTDDESSGMQTSTATTTDDNSSGVPGFGVGVTLVALVAAALVALRRQ
ncbi:PKD domain-containing protein [Halorussus gelatinilyticus]|uniref:PKD domain-containing protein n=1 Tax=Halorussus gelatinilyticus TaxID=2937524 RepID=A0A8U0IFN1_9EURY|nr:PKD domain-containing protein [Halorussus gelatinilyticus]UPV99879.1 PKD domain-containing protein [Halorussus gelatinilyticus]